MTIGSILTSQSERKPGRINGELEVLASLIAQIARTWSSALQVQIAGRCSNTYYAYVNPWDIIAAARANQRSTGSPAKPLHQCRQTDPEVDQLIKRYGELRSLRLVAAEFGIDRSTARAHPRARGVVLAPPAFMTTSHAAAAIELYGQGRSSAAIGNIRGVTNKTVIKELRAAGVAIRPPVGRGS